jgi:uncharacterized protein YciI
MKYFAALLEMIDPVKNQELRPQHLEYLEQKKKEGKLFARGPFADGSGGLVIYKAETYEEAKKLAEEDPYVKQGVRKLILREWNMSQ